MIPGRFRSLHLWLRWSVNFTSYGKSFSHSLTQSLGDCRRPKLSIGHGQPMHANHGV